MLIYSSVFKKIFGLQFNWYLYLPFFPTSHSIADLVVLFICITILEFLITSVNGSRSFFVFFSTLSFAFTHFVKEMFTLNNFGYGAKIATGSYSKGALSRETLLFSGTKLNSSFNFAFLNFHLYVRFVLTMILKDLIRHNEDPVYLIFLVIRTVLRIFLKLLIFRKLLLIRQTFLKKVFQIN